MSALGTASPNDRITPPVTVRSPYQRSTALAGGFVRSSKMEDEDIWSHRAYLSDPGFIAYQEALKKEEGAMERLKEIATYMAEECWVLWRKGDGYGSTVLDAVREAFHKSGCEQEPQKNGASANRRKIPGDVRTMVFERDEYRCVKCGSFKSLAVDHIHPYSLGGTDDPDNLQTLCRSCNSSKGAKVEE